MFKHTIAICTGLLALGAAVAAPACAQMAPVYPAAVALPPYEIVAIVRSTGLEPLSRPVRHGPAYTLQAVGPAGYPVHVTVDARLGRIVRVVPAAHPRFAAPVLPPPYARPPAGIAMVPDGYGPGARAAVLPPSFEGPYGSLAGRERLPPGPGRPAATTAADGQASPTPLPRPRPQFAAAEPPPAATVAPQTPPPAAANDTKDAKPAGTRAAPPVVELHE
jgi:hypothetical protein